MSKAYTPFEKAFRRGNWSLFASLGSIVFILLMFVYDGSGYLGFCILASVVSALVALVFALSSLSLQATDRGRAGLILASILLCIYGVVIYLMKDLCVIC